MKVKTGTFEKPLESESNEKIRDYFFNKKTANAVGISAEIICQNKSRRLIYENKSIKMKVYYCCIKEKNVIVEQFCIYSTWWGPIKSSFFTIDNNKENLSEVKCGIIDRKDLKSYEKSKNPKINNRKLENFQDLITKIKKETKKRPSYKVDEVISQSPSKVKIEINVPSYGTFTWEGKNQQEAAKDFAQNFYKIVEEKEKVLK
jgi:hypothetical protein